MTTLINRIDLDADNRISVYLDEFGVHECPAEWGDPSDSGMLTLRAARGFQSYSIGDHASGAQNAIDAYDEYMPFNGGNREDPMWAGITHLKRQGFSVKYVSLRGNSQSDWMDVLIWARGDDFLNGLIESIESWFSGDIFMVVHETRSTWAKFQMTPEPGEFTTFEQWDCQDSVSGVYFSNEHDEREVVQFARDNFGIEIPETASAS